MKVDDIKNIWKDDMSQLETQLQINEEKIQQLEFNKAQSSFDTFLKISIAGKNMALIYAVISVALMYVVRDAPLYILMLAIGAALMVFSYFQHSVLKNIDYASLSIVELQKAIYNFRKHTARTGVYDISIVAVWLITASLAFMKWRKGFDIFENPVEIGVSSILVGVILLLAVVFSKVIYKQYDVKLKEIDDNLSIITNYENE